MRTLFLCLPLLLQYLSFGQKVTINGILQSRPDVTIRFNFPEDPIHGSIDVAKVTTNKRGAFSTSFELDRKRPVRIDYAIKDGSNDPRGFHYYLWIEPGKTLSLTIQSDSVLHFSGDCEKENNLLKSIGLSGAVDYDTPDKDFKSFSQRIDAQKEGRLELLSTAIKGNAFSPEFIAYVKAEILYYNYQHKIQFIYNYPEADPHAVSSFLSTVDVLSDKAFYSLKFRNGLWRYFDLLSTGGKGDTSESYTLRTFRIIDQRLTAHPKTKEYVKAYLLKFGFAFEQNIDSLKEALASLETEFPYSRHLPYFYKRIDEKIALLYAQKTIPDIALIDTSGREVSLRNFSGKVLFLDFWFSSCVPCMAEMPYSVKLHEQLDSSQVVFIYINNPTDSEQKWKATIRKAGLKGIQLKADAKAQKQLQDYYVFTNFPFYVVHDKTGKPVNIEGGIRPSKNAKDVLTTLITNEPNGH